MSNIDWRITNQENYLKEKEFKFAKFIKTNNSDHEHCEFCWKKFLENDLGYCTLDQYYWVCESCFKDFKASFGWSVVE